MAHRVHLFSLRLAYALRESLAEGYSRQGFVKDIIAGVTVGVIAMPLAMALAIACGVAPQFGLYTAFIGGVIIALAGGSRYSVSGPTAAFVVILFPIVQQYGLAGLLLASTLSGVIMIAMAYARLGRFIEFIPESVTLGFTGGIAVVIATLQLKELLGLPIEEMPENYIDKIIMLANSLGEINIQTTLLSLFTLFVVWLWTKFKTSIPPYLPALLLASFFGVWINNHGYPIETISSRFSYALLDGGVGHGIPPYLPSFEWPWQRPGVDGGSFILSWGLLVNLLPSAFAIAMLGAMESLLCAVVLDGMSGKRHSANSELLGQGIGNIVVSFFGGVTATAAIARSAVNFKSGAQSPLGAVIHGFVVLAGLLFLSPWLSYLPMPAMAAMLLVVAWNMSEAGKSMRILKRAPAGDVIVLVICFSLTVLFDMIIAITAGILLASLLFMKDIAAMTRLSEVSDDQKLVVVSVPEGWRVYKVSGPLFFAAADRIFAELSIKMQMLNGVVLCLEDVPLLDNGGVSAMTKLVQQCSDLHKEIYFTGLQFQPLKTLAHAEIQPIAGVSRFFSSRGQAIDSIKIESLRSV